MAPYVGAPEIKARRLVLTVEYHGQIGNPGYVSGEGGTLGVAEFAWVDPDAGEEQITLEAASYYRPQLSPDGSRVAFSLQDRDNVDMWVSDLLRPGARIRVTTAPGLDSAPHWTPDGQGLVFQSDRGGALGLYRKAADGTGEAEALLTVEGARFLHTSDYGPDGPDGQTLLVAAGMPQTQTDLGVVSLAGDSTWQTVLSTAANEGNPTLSPDGNWIAYRSDDSGSAEVYVAAFPSMDGRQRVSVGGGHSPTWSSDGGRLFYQNETGMMVVAVGAASSLTLSTPEVLFEGDYLNDFSRAYDIAPDGRFLMMKPVGGGSAAEINVVLNWTQELLERVPLP